MDYTPMKGLAYRGKRAYSSLAVYLIYIGILQVHFVTLSMPGSMPGVYKLLLMRRSSYGFWYGV